MDTNTVVVTLLILLLGGSDPYGFYTLDPVSGELTLTSQLDFDDLVARSIPTSQTLTLIARDNGVNQQETTFDVTIDITDSDNNVPVCTPVGPISLTVTENAVTSQVVSSPFRFGKRTDEKVKSLFVKFAKESSWP